MDRPTLEELTDDLDAKTVETLGDPFTIQSGEESPVMLMGFVDHSEDVRDYGYTTVQHGDHLVEMRMSDWPVKPTTEVFYLPRLGKYCVPRDVRADRSGRWWGVLLKRRPG